VGERQQSPRDDLTGSKAAAGARSLPVIRYTRRMASPATTNARTGASSAGIITFPANPSPSTASGPSATKAAPTIPPMSACDELEGRPKYQVIRFQAIAPTNPPNTISSVTSSVFTTSFATVAATSRDTKAPTKLRTAA
jgi:hypothetical protein